MYAFACETVYKYVQPPQLFELPPPMCWNYARVSSKDTTQSCQRKNTNDIETIITFVTINVITTF